MSFARVWRDRARDRFVKAAVQHLKMLGADGESARGSERLGFFAHELRNLTNTALVAFEVLKTGNVGVAGSTGAVLHRSLTRLRALIGRSLAEVRLTQGIQNRTRADRAHRPFSRIVTYAAAFRSACDTANCM
jgi:hypothetical protein